MDYNQAVPFPFKQDCTNVGYNQADTFPFKWKTVPM